MIIFSITTTSVAHSNKRARACRHLFLPPLVARIIKLLASISALLKRSGGPIKRRGRRASQLLEPLRAG